MELRGTPGFSDLMTISQKLAEETKDQFLRFQGWDKDQLLGIAEAGGRRA